MAAQVALRRQQAQEEELGISHPIPIQYTTELLVKREQVSNNSCPLLENTPAASASTASASTSSSENKTLVQDIPPAASRGHVDNTSDFAVDSAYYSNFYQPPLYPYYNNLYNYTSYQMAMTADPTSTGDLSAIRGIPPSYTQGKPGNQWQIKSNDNRLPGYNTGSQYRMHSYYPSYMGQSMAAPACVTPIITFEENFSYPEVNASETFQGPRSQVIQETVFSPPSSQDSGLVTSYSSVSRESTKYESPTEASPYTVTTNIEDGE